MANGHKGAKVKGRCRPFHAAAHSMTFWPLELFKYLEERVNLFLDLEAQWQMGIREPSGKEGADPFMLQCTA